MKILSTHLLLVALVAMGVPYDRLRPPCGIVDAHYAPFAPPLRPSPRTIAPPIHSPTESAKSCNAPSDQRHRSLHFPSAPLQHPFTSLQHPVISFRATHLKGLPENDRILVAFRCFMRPKVQKLSSKGPATSVLVRSKMLKSPSNVIMHTWRYFVLAP